MSNGTLQRQFQENGFVILKGVLNEEQLQRYRAMTDRIVAYAEQGLPDPFEKYFLKHRVDQGVLYDLYQRHPEFHDAIRVPAVLDALETVLGPDIYMYTNSLIYKPKGKRNGVPWHQDFGKRPNEPIKYITWIALDKTSRENGCVKVIPGTHQRGFIPHITVQGETHHDRLPESAPVDPATAIYAELEAGDAVIFNMLLVHGSDEVHTDLPRRGFRIAYQGFADPMFAPRGCPIAVRGGSPESLAKRFSQRAQVPPKSGLVKFINRLGKKLATLGGDTSTASGY